MSTDKEEAKQVKRAWEKSVIRLCSRVNLDAFLADYWPELLRNLQDYDALSSRLAEAERRVKDLEGALTSAQQGVVLYLSDPHKVKTYAHAAVFIELLGERLSAALPSHAGESHD